MESAWREVFHRRGTPLGTRAPWSVLRPIRQRSNGSWRVGSDDALERAQRPAWSAPPAGTRTVLRAALRASAADRGTDRP